MTRAQADGYECVMDKATERSERQSMTKREQKKTELRNRINEALIMLISEGGDINHDVLADRVSVSRRTIYRYYPDRDALLESVWSHVAEMAFGGVKVPKNEAELTTTLHDIYTAFDRLAPIITLVGSTPQGRAMRLASRKRRVESFIAAAGDAVRQLPPEDQKLATAVIQVLHAVPWLEMRDQWGLTGEQIARATSWAIRTLLADLRARGSVPLDEPAPRETRATANDDRVLAGDDAFPQS